VGKKDEEPREPGKLTIAEIVTLLVALSGLVSTIHGNNPVQLG
jgi:hypothetical protein